MNQSFDEEQGQKLYEAGVCAYDEEKFEKAIDYFKNSALHGNAEGTYRYGEMILLGEGCEKDEFTSAFWLWQASQMGCAEAMTDLGVCYHKGIGVWRSKVRGLYYFSLAALHHNPSGVYNVGLSLQREDVVADNAAFGRIFKRAAEEMTYKPLALSFVDKNAKILLEITAEALVEREGGV